MFTTDDDTTTIGNMEYSHSSRSRSNTCSRKRKGKSSSIMKEFTEHLKDLDDIRENSQDFQFNSETLKHLEETVNKMNHLDKERSALVTCENSENRVAILCKSIGHNIDLYHGYVEEALNEIVSKLTTRAARCLHRISKGYYKMNKDKNIGKIFVFPPPSAGTGTPPPPTGTPPSGTPPSGTPSFYSEEDIWIRDFLELIDTSETNEIETSSYSQLICEKECNKNNICNIDCYDDKRTKLSDFIKLFEEKFIPKTVMTGKSVNYEETTIGPKRRNEVYLKEDEKNKIRDMYVNIFSNTSTIKNNLDNLILRSICPFSTTEKKMIKHLYLYTQILKFRKYIYALAFINDKKREIISSVKTKLEKKYSITSAKECAFGQHDVSFGNPIQQQQKEENSAFFGLF